MDESNDLSLQRKKVFICYAREDEKAAIRLYAELKECGLLPWRDKIAILPGENYKLAIRGAIKGSRYFVPLLSSASVQKVGFVQKELRYAIDNSYNYPQGTINIIPARLDECKIPFDELEELEYVDLFPDWEAGLYRIFDAMNIDRSKKTNLMAPKEQDWKMGLAEEYWTGLITSIINKKCIVFIGPNVYTIQSDDDKEKFIPLSKSIINKWKRNSNLELDELFRLARVDSLEDSYQLARVAQFLEIGNPEDGYSKRVLCDMLRKIRPSDFPYGQAPYDILAKLDLPIYMTTNYDRFMEESLSRNPGKRPESDFCKWSEELTKYTKAAGIRSVFDEPYFKPTDERPLVYHINGDMNIPESMVLTEKDYFEFVINLNKSDEKDIIPSVIRTGLATSSLLFIGYTLEDINFRTIFQGFLSFLASLRGVYRKTSIAVQIPPGTSRKEQSGVQGYIENYTNNLFHVHVYWGTTSDFLKELDRRWEDFKKNESNRIANEV